MRRSVEIHCVCSEHLFQIPTPGIYLLYDSGHSLFISRYNLKGSSCALQGQREREAEIKIENPCTEQFLVDFSNYSVTILLRLKKKKNVCGREILSQNSLLISLSSRIIPRAQMCALKVPISHCSNFCPGTRLPGTVQRSGERIRQGTLPVKPDP